jgi:hypothetical protein
MSPHARSVEFRKDAARTIVGAFEAAGLPRIDVSQQIAALRDYLAAGNEPRFVAFPDRHLECTLEFETLGKQRFRVVWELEPGPDSRSLRFLDVTVFALKPRLQRSLPAPPEAADPCPPARGETVDPTKTQDGT